MIAGSTARRVLVPLVLVAAAAGCGPTPPQAPFHEAKRLDASTGDISTACGLAFQVTAFPGDHRKDLANLEASANLSVRSLASVYHRNPAWIYQGETIQEIVTDTLAMLRTCGLEHAATTLERATARHRS